MPSVQGSNNQRPLSGEVCLDDQQQLEMALSESEARYRSLAELSPDAVCIHSDGRLVYLNTAMARALGAENPEQLLGTPVMDLVPPESYAANMEMLVRLAQGGILPPTEQKVIRLDGTTIEGEIVGSQVLFQGKPAYQLMIRDLSDRRHAEEALRESEEKFRLLIEQNPAGVVLIDEQGLVIEWNQAQERISGLPRENALGKPVWEIQTQMLPPQDQTPNRTKSLKTLITAALETGQSPMFHSPMEIAIARPDGQQFFVQQTAFPIKTDAGYRIGSLLRDVTGRKQAEQALLERERQLEQIIQQMPFPVEIAAVDGTALAVNRSFLETFGIPSADLVVGNFNVFTDPMLVRSGLLEQIRAAFRGETVFIPEVEIQLPQIAQQYQVAAEGVQWHDITLFPVLGETGEVWRVVTIWKDATERRAARWELERRLVELETLQAVAQAGTEAASLDDLIERVTELVRSQLYPENFGIALYDPETGLLAYHPSSRVLVGSLIPPFPLSQGVTGAVARSRIPRRVGDVRLDPDYFSSSSGILSELCVPITVGPRLIGVMNAEKTELNAFSLADERLLVAVAGEIGTAIEKVWLFEAERNRRRELEALTEVSAVVRTAETLDEMLPSVLDRIGNVLDVQGAAFAFRDPKDGALVFALGSREWEPIRGIRMPQGAGIGSQVVASRKLYCSTDARSDPQMFRKDLIGTAHNLLCLPLISKEETVGLLYLGRDSAFQPNDLRLAQATVDIVASAVHRVQLREQSERQMEHLLALREIDRSILSNSGLEETLTVLSEKITSLLKLDAAVFWLYQPHQNNLKSVARWGTASIRDWSFTLGLPNTHAGRAALSREMEFIPDLSQVDDELSRNLRSSGEDFTSYLALPLLAKGEIKGVLELFHTSRLDPDPSWLEFLKALAGQAAIAIDNAQLLQEQQQTNLKLISAYDATIDGWSRALDQRDHETEGHSRRVTELTLLLARRLGLSTEMLEHIRRGAQLHDIGKMGIPDGILLKPGPLTDEEWEIMRLHPQLALDFLYPIDFLQPALEIPFCHHEKWDGSGYPLGLQGEEIPLSARIFAVVDVWDALTSNRPYRPAWEKDRALAYIREQSGKHFDPQLVAAFMDLIELKNPR